MEINREYRSSVFAMLFNDRKVLLSLYNAVNGTEYTDEDEITINTLEDEGVPSGVMMKMKNDLSFIFRSYLNLYEHQSTVCGNLSLRLLLYVSRLLQQMIPKKKLYSSGEVRLPAPKFLVFYNGTVEIPERQEILMSDLYEVQEAEPDLELKATVFNVNKGHNRELMEKCRALSEYAEFVARMQEVIVQKPDRNALRGKIELVLNKCIEDNILRDFLRNNREAVIMYSILAYDEEAHEQAIREDAIEEEHVKTEAERQRADREKARADNAEALAAGEKIRADNAEARAAGEKVRADNAEAQVRELKAELERLKAKKE